MKKYQKPTVINGAYSPEPVEAGCCLRSCGGSPHHSEASKKSESLIKKVNRGLKEVKKA